MGENLVRNSCIPHSLSETPNWDQAISWEEFLSLAGGGKGKLFSIKSLSPVRISLREQNSLSQLCFAKITSLEKEKQPFAWNWISYYKKVM